jgi:hypothetical protein
MVIYPHPLVALSVDCAKGKLSVSFGGKTLDSGGASTMQATYRFDDHPAVENENWTADGVTVEPAHPDAFLEQMASSRQLLIRFQGGTYIAHDLSYSLLGFDKVLHQMRTHCPAAGGSEPPAATP